MTNFHHDFHTCRDAAISKFKLRFIERTHLGSIRNEHNISIRSINPHNSNIEMFI